MSVTIRQCVVASLWFLTEEKFYDNHHTSVCFYDNHHMSVCFYGNHYMSVFFMTTITRVCVSMTTIIRLCVVASLWFLIEAMLDCNHQTSLF